MNYVGIDIGDGESCVCLLPAGSGIEPQPVLITGRKSFLSAVALGENGAPMIGLDAVSDSAATEFSVRFKSRFLSGSDDAMKDMSRYLAGLRTALSKTLTPDDKVTVGCPAGWDENDRQRYLGLIQQAGFARARIVSESRGAFLYAKHAKTIQLDPELIARSALVIDIGSSTLDFAYVVDGRETNVGVFGDVYLGGGAIDDAILAAAVNASSKKAEIERVFEAAPSWRSHCLLAARQVKEDFFTQQSRGSKNIQCQQMVTILYDDPLPLRIQVNEKLILRVIGLPISALGGQSFSCMLASALRSAAEKTQARPPELVLLTGGASRMGFFQEQCRERFKDAILVLCEEPEFSIAKGLAYSARVDDEILAFNEAINEYLNTTAIHNATQKRLKPLVEEMARHIARLTCDTLQSCFVRWQNGGYGTLKDMNSAVVETVKAALDGSKEQRCIEDIMKNELTQLCLAIQPDIDNICLQHGVAVSQMKLTGSHVPKGSIDPRFDLEGQLTNLSGRIQVLIVALLAGVLLAIPGGGIFDLILIAAAAVLVPLFHLPIDQLIMQTNIPVFLRRHISSDSVVTDKLRADLTESFYQKLDESVEFKNGVIENIRESVSAYVRGMALRTEIAIR